MNGFEATMAACKALGLDLSNIPRGTLQIFYNSGMAFADHSGGFDAKARQEWRDSVIWPRVNDSHKGPLNDERPTLPPIIQNPRKRGRPPKHVVVVENNGH
jgi:hypothetical protein